MSGRIAVIGYGAVGAATAERLAAAGRPVVVAQRQPPSALPAGVDFRRCDVLDAESVRAAVAGAEQVVLAVGFPYVGALWRDAWPKTLAIVVDACATAGARLVFFDNLYMYGPQTAPLSEATPLQPYGVKPAARVAATRVWMAASQAGRLRVAAVRAPDFYGPGVTLSHLGDTAFGALIKGGRATFIGSPDTPHDFAYVPDCGRAVVSLLDAPDDAFGQAWHVPCAPTRTPRANPGDRRSGDRRRAEGDRSAAGADRPARPVRPAAARDRRDALPVGPSLPRRLEQVRRAVLVRRDAVRSRRAGDGQMVPRSRRQGLISDASPGLVWPAAHGRKRARRRATAAASRRRRPGPARTQPSSGRSRMIIGATPGRANAQMLRSGPTRASMPSARAAQARWPPISQARPPNIAFSVTSRSPLSAARSHASSAKSRAILASRRSRPRLTEIWPARSAWRAVLARYDEVRALPASPPDR